LWPSGSLINSLSGAVGGLFVYKTPTLGWILKDCKDRFVFEHPLEFSSVLTWWHFDLRIPVSLVFIRQPAIAGMMLEFQSTISGQTTTMTHTYDAATGLIYVWNG
jgi:hypothetical protein